MTDLHSELQSWLETATENLAPEGKARVVADVVRRYESRVQEELVQSGEDLMVSEKLALKNLGDPVRAGKEFEEMYLTQYEACFLTPVDFKAFFFSNKPDPSAQPFQWCVEYTLILVLIAMPLLPVIYLTPLSTMLAVLFWVGGFLLKAAGVLTFMLIMAGACFIFFETLVRKVLNGPIDKQTFKRVLALRFCFVLSVPTTWAMVSFAITNSLATALERFFSLGFSILVVLSFTVLIPQFRIYKKLPRESHTF